MKSVVKEELELMDNESMRCAIELSDAAVEVQAYACLVAIMSMGKGYHSTSREKLYNATLQEKQPTPVVNSAGALIEALHTLGARKISFICPYMKPLAKLVADYIEYEGIEVHDMIALEIPGNLDVAAQDPNAPASLWKKLDTKGVDAIIASACVQMPSLPSIDAIEQESGIPTLSAAVATTRSILKELNLEPIAPMGGSLLSGTTVVEQQKA